MTNLSLEYLDILIFLYWFQKRTTSRFSYSLALRIPGHPAPPVSSESIPGMGSARGGNSIPSSIHWPHAVIV
uniref:Uncharacterized protein n=1 Tax=Anguilla anguilla TaxID=7936 RepID=A0A0E9RF14_ANGAN